MFNNVTNNPPPSSTSTPANLNIPNPRDPPGFGIIIDLSPTHSFPPEKVHLAAITVLYDWASRGYTHKIPYGPTRYSMQTYDIVVNFRSLALGPAPSHRQLETRYLIFGFLHLIDKMRKVDRYCVGVASVLAFREPVGLLRLDVPGRSRGDSVPQLDGTLNDGDDGGNDVKNSTALSARRRIVDPKDPHFAITYEITGESMTWVDFLSGILFAIATAAQYDDEVCEGTHCIAGINAQRTAVYIINGIRSTRSIYILSFENVRRGLVLLATRMYSAGVCGEVEVGFEMDGDVYGGGRIMLNDYREDGGGVDDEV
ncbi:MAG: hypothetical protein Q9169_005186 [Polycauliona sp. 2 TL-2023]